MTRIICSKESCEYCINDECTRSSIILGEIDRKGFNAVCMSSNSKEGKKRGMKDD